jgi:pilus assembly protein CpaC
MQSDANNLINQYPLLGDVPVLGALFRSTDFQRNETELVIIVTVRLAKPVAAGSLKNITDSYIPPNMLDQYLLGRLEGGLWFYRGDFFSRAGKPKDSDDSAGLDGSFGHQVAGVN